MGFEASTLVYLTSAIVAGVTVATATAPIWLVKTRMQLQRDDKSNVCFILFFYFIFLFYFLFIGF